MLFSRVQIYLVYHVDILSCIMVVQILTGTLIEHACLLQEITLL